MRTLLVRQAFVVVVQGLIQEGAGPGCLLPVVVQGLMQIGTSPGYLSVVQGLIQGGAGPDYLLPECRRSFVLVRSQEL